MNSIIQVAKELVEKKKDFVTYDEIIENLGETKMSQKELKAVIYTDLLVSGIFFFKENGFNLKENFTLEELNRYRAELTVSSMDEESESGEVEDEIYDEIIDNSFDEDEEERDDITLEDVNLNEVVDD